MKKSLFFALILTGVTAISSQVILLREFLTVFYGNELSVGFLLCIWLLGGAAGAQAARGNREVTFEQNLSVFANCQILLSIFIPLAVMLIRLPRPIVGINVGEIIGIPVMLLWGAFSLTPVCFVLGFMFVRGCGLYQVKSPEKKITITYLLESIGAGIGGVVTSLILVRFFNNLEIAFLIGLLNLVSLGLMTGYKMRQQYTYRFVSVTGVIIFAFMLAAGGVRCIDRYSLSLKWKGVSIVDSRDSIYGNVSLANLSGQYTFFMNGVHMSSAPDKLTAEEIAHFPMLLHPAPRNVLLIGGGVGDVPDEILKYKSARITYVELNPLVIDFARKYLNNKEWYRLSDSRLTIKYADARHFIKNTDDRFDVVIIDLPNPYTIQLNRFYTVEFYKELYRILNEGAIVAFSAVSSENYISYELGEFLKSIYFTASAVFPDVKVIPGDTAYFLAARKPDAINLDHNYIEKERASRGIQTHFVREYYLFSKLSPERIRYINGIILSGAKSVIGNLNTDFRPISYYYDMILWSTYFSSQFSHFLKRAATIGLWRMFAVPAIALLVFSYFRRKNASYPNFAVLFAVASTGCSEITFQILIILAFQVLCGYLYFKLGIIIASFMIGLSAGTLYILRRIDSLKHCYKTFIRVQVFVLVYPLILAAIFFTVARMRNFSHKTELSDIIFSLLPFIAGFVGGVQFPVANKIYLSRDNQTMKAAGVTYSLDLIGACIGAILISTFIIPLVGIYGTCVSVTLLNFIALIMLVMGSGRQGRTFAGRSGGGNLP